MKPRVTQGSVLGPILFKLYTRDILVEQDLTVATGHWIDEHWEEPSHINWQSWKLHQIGYWDGSTDEKFIWIG